MRQAVVICHERHEGLAGFRAPIEARGYAIAELFADDPAFMDADLLEPDLVVVLGGSMGVYEAERYPWMGLEIIRLCERIAANRPTIGVCLGAQLMAAALGSKVYKGPAVEVGFAPVTLTAEGRTSPLAELGDTPLLHWHGDSFDLPDGAERLASTALYANQAFALGPHILALQFHPEMGEDPGFADWIARGSDFIAAGGQTPERIAEDYRLLGPRAVSAGQAMLDRWLAGFED